MPNTIAIPLRFAVALLAFAWHATAAFGAVAVVSNQTDEDHLVRLTDDGGQSGERTLPAGQTTPLFSASPITLTLPTAAGPITERMAADAIYWITPSEDRAAGIELRRVGLAGEDPLPADKTDWGVGAGPRRAHVPVLLCVDEDEPYIERLWQARLKNRLAEASEIIAAHAGVRFVFAGFARWESDDAITDFESSLREFEREVIAPRDTLAIGFTSQYKVEIGRRRLGGTRGPLRRHIFLREFSPRLGEAERVELLVHELGHYLSAAHSVEPTSVMRPVLGNRPVRLLSERVRFDSLNTLAIAMIGEEVRNRGVRRFGQVSRDRRDRLEQVYATLAMLGPDDPAAPALLAALRRSKRGRPGARPNPQQRSPAQSDLTVAARDVVRAVTAVAAANAKLPIDQRLKDDALADALVRAGGRATQHPAGLLLGLGIALDDIGGLQKHPRTKSLVAAVESPSQRALRLNVLGNPTAQGRADILKHFVISAALAAIAGEAEAHLWGVGKELADATRTGGSGFSFADLAADRAGVRFARSVLEKVTDPASIGRAFLIEQFVPSLDGFEEGIGLTDLVTRFGSTDDPRFKAEVKRIDEQIEALPPYELLQFEIPGI